ncbi:MAG: hypothetical protein RLZZ397_1240 [Pseudomonadota bacterium]|jgi:D-alanyl-D-alanine endopeptidase (penicillin-binding protein 7)
MLVLAKRFQAIVVGLSLIFGASIALLPGQAIAKSESRVQVSSSSARSAVKPKAQAKGREAKPSQKRKVVKRKYTSPKASAKAPKRKVAARRGSSGIDDGRLKLDAKGMPILKSSAAFVVDADTHEVLVNKNDSDVLPIASLTKLMTALVINDAQLPMDEIIQIQNDDVDRLKGSSSRLAVGTRLTRAEALQLALMSSENRAAHALGRTWPLGMGDFVHQMNLKAKLLGMTDSQFVEPTGLSSSNRSSARDLATLVHVASDRPMIRELSVADGYSVRSGRRQVDFRNTNYLVRQSNWDITLQKTGYISEAGRCLVMDANVLGRRLIMVFLDSSGKLTRYADAQRVKDWLAQRSESRSGPGSVQVSHQTGRVWRPNGSAPGNPLLLKSLAPSI